MRAVPVVVLLAACGSATPLESLQVALRAERVGEELWLGLRLHDSEDSYVRYEQQPGERLVVLFQGEETPLIGTTYGDDHFVARRPFKPIAADEELTFRFERDGESEVATATAPPPFTLHPPAPTKYTEPVVVTWSPVATDPMRWEGTLCTFSGRGEGPVRTDTGSLTFPAGVLAAPGASECEITLNFKRERMSAPSSAFDYASITVVQSEVVNVLVTP